MTVYILHFEKKLHHAQHYIGSTYDLSSRMAQHRNGTGARLVRAMSRAGIPWRLACTWDGEWGLERYLKRQKNGPRLCPICQLQRKLHKRGGGSA